MSLLNNLFSKLKKNRIKVISESSPVEGRLNIEEAKQTDIEFRQKAYKKFVSHYKLDTIEDIIAIPDNINMLYPHDYCYTTEPETLLGYKYRECKDNGNNELALACLKKANSIMFNSKTHYDISKYMYLVKELRSLRMFGEAQQEEEKILKEYKPLKIDTLSRALEFAEEFGTDLVCAVVSNGREACCAECAKYRNRVYSISGRDKRYPFLDSNVKKCCCLFFNSYQGFESIIGAGVEIKSTDVIKYSNRPFIDERTSEQKQWYNHFEQEKREKAIFEEQKAKDQKEYDWLWEFMPEITPKSFGGYRKMKNSNSANFLKIKEKALEKGFVLK